jgi:hypothetical protein
MWDDLLVASGNDTLLVCDEKGNIIFYMYVLTDR